MLRFSRDVPGNNVVQSTFSKPPQHCCGSRYDEAVQQYRNLTPPRGKRSTEHGSEFPSANMLEGKQRVLQRRAMASKRSVYDSSFARQSFIVNTCPTANPVGATATEQGRSKGRRNRRVADAHLAERNEIGVLRNRIHASFDRREKFALAHRRSKGKIGSRSVDIERDHLQLRAGHLRQLVDCCAAGIEVVDHLRVQFRWKGRDATCGDSVRTGKDQNADIVEARQRLSLPAGEKSGQFLQPPEASQRFGQFSLPCSSSLRSSCVTLWQIAA